jgi:uncharacterized membrane protein
MEGLIIALILLFVASPILSIVALVKLSHTREEVRKQNETIDLLRQTLRSGPPPKESTAPEPIKTEPVPPVIPDFVPVLESKPVPPPVPKRKNIEIAFGGQIFGLIGVMILVAGIAFLVGSAGISWPEPVAKIWIGLGCGALLLAGGFMADRNQSGKFKMLSRIMTGGGGGLFYFCVFAAYSLYDLTGSVTTAAGLTISAALLLWLSLCYNSQTVSCLGVLGAFITPVLVGGDFDDGIFPLVYIGLINLPVMILGVKRNWQVLYNGAYLFTLIYFGYWLIAFNSDSWITPLLATVGYFLEFVTLSLLIMRKRERTEISELNSGRIVVSSAFLITSLYIIFHGALLSSMLGLCFAGTAILFALLTKIAWKWLPELKAEPLCFLLGSLLSIALIILEQTDDLWTGTVWSIYGVLLAFVALKLRLKPIQNCAIAIGFAGLIHATCQQPTLNGPLLINPHSLAGLFSAALIGLQAWLYQRVADDENISNKSRSLWYVAILAILGISFRNIFTTLPLDEPRAWFMTSAILLFVGIIVSWTMTHDKSLKKFGILLVTLVPFKLLVFDTLVADINPVLSTAWPWLQLALLGTVLWFSERLNRDDEMERTCRPVLQLAPIIVGLAILSFALWELQTDWGRAIVSILWGGSALCITLYGFMRKSKLHRVFALILFGFTVGKVSLIDCATFSAGARVVIFIGVGLILLTLSFTYQKISNRLLQPEKSDEE